MPRTSSTSVCVCARVCVRVRACACVTSTCPSNQGVLVSYALVSTCVLVGVVFLILCCGCVCNRVRGLCCVCKRCVWYVHGGVRCGRMRVVVRVPVEWRNREQRSSLGY